MLDPILNYLLSLLFSSQIEAMRIGNCMLSPHLVFKNTNCNKQPQKLGSVETSGSILTEILNHLEEGNYEV